MTPELQDEVDRAVEGAHRSDQDVVLSDELVEALLGRHRLLLEAGPLDSWASATEIRRWAEERELPVLDTLDWKLKTLKDALTEAFEGEWGDLLEVHRVRHRDGHQAFVLGFYVNADHQGEARSTLGVFPTLERLFVDLKSRELAYRIGYADLDLSELRSTGVIREFEELTVEDMRQVWAD